MFFKTDNVATQQRKNLFIVFCFFFVCGSFLLNAQPADSSNTDTLTQVKTGDTIQFPQPGFTTGDALQIRVHPDTGSFVNGIYFIDDKGCVDLPIIGYVKATGHSADELALIIRNAYVDYLPQPNILVRPLVRVCLLGGFYRPGLYWVDARETMWGVIRLAGGTQREDGLEKIEWRRNRQILTKDIVPYIEAGNSLSSIGFKSGDQLTVTVRPKQRGWDLFRTDVLPMLTFTISTAASVATLYMAWESFQARQQGNP